MLHARRRSITWRDRAGPGALPTVHSAGSEEGGGASSGVALELAARERSFAGSLADVHEEARSAAAALCFDLSRVSGLLAACKKPFAPIACSAAAVLTRMLRPCSACVMQECGLLSCMGCWELACRGMQARALSS
jgi:hypothetical protein